MRFKRSCFLPAFLILLICGEVGFAQTEEADSIAAYSSTQSENAESNTIRQPFSWESAGDVLKYEILIEHWNEETQVWETSYTHETNDDETEDCLVYIEPVLPPGQYRSLIKVYNILGLLEEDFTTREEFTIHRAFRPEVKDVSYPLYMRKVIYLDDLDNNGIIEVEGRNLFMPDDTHKSLSYTDYLLKADKRIIRPQSVLSHDDANNRKIKFQFDMKKLEVGNYYFIAQDASGLHSEENNASEFVVRFKKWADFDVEGGYVLPVVLHDETINKFLGTNLFPFSAQAKITFIPYKRNWGYLGAGLKVQYSRINSTFDTYTIDGNIETAHLMFVYQVPAFKRRLFTELRAGAGVTYFNDMYFHFDNNIDSDVLNTLCLSFDAGASFMFYINKRLYIEAGADYIFTLNADMNMGMISPMLGVGWQF